MIGIGLGLTLGGRAGSGDTRTLTFVASGGSSAATTAPSGALTGCALFCVVLKTTTTAPTFDPTGGAQIGSWSGNSTSAIAFWQYAASDTPPFGTHTGGTRCQWWAYRFSDPPVAPFGTPIRSSNPASLVMGWAGLTLAKSQSQVATIGHRNANDPLIERTDALQTSAPVGSTSRYAFMRSNGAVGSWPAMDLAQLVSGVHQSIAVEVGY